MTNHVKNKYVENRIMHRNADLVRYLSDFTYTKNRQGFDILVPQCFSLNHKYNNKLAQNLNTIFPVLASNLDIFVTNNKNYGHTQIVTIDNTINKNLNKIYFANMVCVRSAFKRKLDYIALSKCMSEIAVFIKNKQQNTENDKIHIMSPKFGTGFLGGNWSFIEQLIIDSWDSYTTTIYTHGNETAY